MSEALLIDAGTVLLAAWARVHAIRSEMWGEIRLKYEDVPEPEIHGLDPLKLV
jgi:hypothetical protein